MSASDWIALGAGIIALASLGLAAWTYRHQASQDRSDAEQKLADQIKSIQKELAKLGPTGADDRSIDVVARNTTVTAALQGLVLRTNQLIKAHHLKPDWFETVVLANAYLSMADMAGADIWVNKAVDLARKELSRYAEDDRERPVAAMVLSLRMQALFFFERSAEGDADQGRTAFADARDAVKSFSAMQGPLCTHSQLIELFIGQAYYEAMVGANDRAVALIGAACEEWQKLRAPGARYGMCMYIAAFLRNQPLLPVDDLALPTDFKEQMDKLPPEPLAGGMVRRPAPPPPVPLPDPRAMQPIVEAARSPVS